MNENDQLEDDFVWSIGYLLLGIGGAIMLCFLVGGIILISGI